MKYILETEQLRLREFNLGDTSFIVELVNSPGWLAFIGDRNIRTEEAARVYLENGPIKSYHENGFGLWLVEDKDGVSIGMCGVLKRDSLEKPDIGFAFLPEFTGKGYAYEIANATVKYAHAALDIPELLAITVPANERSIRLLRKIGFSLVKPIQLPHSDEELLLYSDVYK